MYLIKVEWYINYVLPKSIKTDYQLFSCALNLYLLEYNQKILSIILVLEKFAVLL